MSKTLRTTLILLLILVLSGCEDIPIQKGVINTFELNY